MLVPWTTCIVSSWVLIVAVAGQPAKILGSQSCLSSFHREQFPKFSYPDFRFFKGNDKKKHRFLINSYDTHTHTQIQSKK